MKSGKKGQNLTEFVIIIVLVSITAILVLGLLGKNINGIFSLSAEKVGDYDPFRFKSESIVVKASQPTVVTPVNREEVLNGIKVNYHKDGSVSFNAGGQMIKLNSEIMGLTNQVYEAAGTAGDDLFLTEIINMINKHKDEYPGQQVPLNIQFGLSRMYRGSGGTYMGGVAQANTYMLQVGNDIIVAQRDQSCNPPDSPDCTSKSQRKYEGTVDKNGKFTGLRYHVGLDKTFDQDTSPSDLTVDITFDEHGNLKTFTNFRQSEDSRDGRIEVAFDKAFTVK